MIFIDFNKDQAFSPWLNTVIPVLYGRRTTNAEVNVTATARDYCWSSSSVVSMNFSTASE
jgi:hypothetical protein